MVAAHAHRTKWNSKTLAGRRRDGSRAGSEYTFGANRSALIRAFCTFKRLSARSPDAFGANFFSCEGCRHVGKIPRVNKTMNDDCCPRVRYQAEICDSKEVLILSALSYYADFSQKNRARQIIFNTEFRR
jgi:hypothetical protein